MKVDKEVQCWIQYGKQDAFTTNTKKANFAGFAGKIMEFEGFKKTKNIWVQQHQWFDVLNKNNKSTQTDQINPMMSSTGVGTSDKTEGFDLRVEYNKGIKDWSIHQRMKKWPNVVKVYDNNEQLIKCIDRKLLKTRRESKEATEKRKLDYTTIPGITIKKKYIEISENEKLQKINEAQEREIERLKRELADKSNSLDRCEEILNLEVEEYDPFYYVIHQ